MAKWFPKNPHNIIRKSQPQVFSSAFCPSLEFPMLLLHLSHWSGRFAVCVRVASCCRPAKHDATRLPVSLWPRLSVSVSLRWRCLALVRAVLVAGAAGQQQCLAFSNSCWCTFVAGSLLGVSADVAGSTADVAASIASSLVGKVAVASYKFVVGFPKAVADSFR